MPTCPVFAGPVTYIDALSTYTHKCTKMVILHSYRSGTLRARNCTYIMIMYMLSRHILAICEGIIQRFLLLINTYRYVYCAAIILIRQIFLSTITKLLTTESTKVSSTPVCRTAKQLPLLFLWHPNPEMNALIC